MRRGLLVLVVVLLLHPAASAAAPEPFACGLAAGGWLSEGPTDRAAHLSSLQPALERNPKQRCQALTNAPFDLGPGEDPTFTDKASRTTIQVVAKAAATRTIVVTKG